MNKIFKSYFIVWLIVIIVFNILFLMFNPISISEVNSRLVVLLLSDISFIVVLISSMFMLKENNIEKTFFNMPASYLCHIELIINILIGMMLLINKNMSTKMCIAICFVLIAIMILILILLKTSANYIDDVEKKYNDKVSFIDKSKKISNEIKIYCEDDNILYKEANKLYELILYSKNPKDGTNSLCDEIIDDLIKLKDVVKNKKIDDNSIINQINSISKKIKLINN